MTLKEAKSIVKSKYPRAVCRYDIPNKSYPYRIHSYRYGDPVGPCGDRPYTAWILAATKIKKEQA